MDGWIDGRMDGGMDGGMGGGIVEWMGGGMEPLNGWVEVWNP